MAKEEYTFEDINESEMWLNEGTVGSFIAKLKFPWARADVENKNKRTYEAKVLGPAVQELNTRIIDSGVPGQSDHPEAGSGGITKLRDVSHVLTKVWMDKSNVAWAESGILDTQKGRDALTVIKSKVPIGASLRGFGQLGKNGHVKPGLKIKTIDLVVDPSFGKDARVDQSSLIESYIPESPDEGGSGGEIESQVNTPGDSKSKEQEETMDKIESLESLKKEYPKLTKELEDSVKATMKDEIAKAVTKQVTEQIEAKTEEIKTTVTKGLEKQIKAVNGKIEKVFEIERNHVDALAKIEGFIPEDEENKGKENTEEASTKITKQVEGLEEKNTKLQTTIDEMKAGQKKEKETAELQGKLREVLTTECAKEGNKPYTVLIEKELVAENGSISIESVDKVEEVVNTAKKKVSAVLVEAHRTGIIESGLTELGKVDNPDVVKEQKQAATTEKTLFQEAKASGFPGTFSDWKKEHGTKKE